MRPLILGAIILGSACMNATGPSEPTEPTLGVGDPCYAIIKEDTVFVETSEFLPSGGAPLESPFVIDTVIHRIYVQVCPPN